MKAEKNHAAALFAAVVLVSFAMRAPMGCVGPLVQEIQKDLGLSAFAAGFLTTIPLIAFAVMSPIAGKLAQWKSSYLILTVCLLLSVFGLLFRSYGGRFGLFAGTVLLGLGIGVLNVLMPALIRHCFPNRIGFMMGVYSTAMTASSALMSGSCQGIAARFGGWQVSLAAPLVFALAALVLSGMARQELVVPRQTGAAARTRLFTAKRVTIALFMGMQSFLFFSLLTWFPSILERNGPLPLPSGTVLLLLQVFSLIPAFSMPILCQRIRRKGLLTCVCTLCFALGFFLMLIGTVPALLCGSAILGIACGATMSLALTFVATQGGSAVETARVSAFSQCVGYALSTVGPSGLGYLYDVFRSWTPPLLFLIVFSLLMALLGLAAGAEKSQSR